MCIFHDKPRHRQFRRQITLQCRYRDVAKTTCGIQQSNYLPLLLYRIPLKGKDNVLSSGVVFLYNLGTMEHRLYNKGIINSN